MKELQNNSDTEVAHRKADDILCDVLLSRGFKELVDEFGKLRKWYA